MRAAYFAEFGGSLSIETLPEPTLVSDGVVIQVKANGICRSDWHGWMGHDADVHLPHVPGHEMVGIVQAVGKDVRKWRVGDRVTLPFACGCGVCAQCVTGNHQVCDDYFQPGFTAWGSFAEYVGIRYADTNLVRVPDQIEDIVAASLGCRFATSFRAVVAQGRVQLAQIRDLLGHSAIKVTERYARRGGGIEPRVTFEEEWTGRVLSRLRELTE